jgi:hypothetical protein
LGKGSNTTTSNTTSSPDPQAAQAYRDLLARAQGVASTPYQAYTGELTAPVNAQQQAGIAGINANANFATPYIQQAAGLAGAAANPLTAGQIQQYQNPYTQNVVDATQNQFNRQNTVAKQGVVSNQIATGALGGNRVGVENANLANAQQTAQAPVIAGLYSNSYNSGLQTAAQQFQQNPLAAGNAIANYGISGQGAALAGAGAQLGAGTLQQQTQQAANTANYGQYQQQQAYPYQQAQWLAGLQTGVGSNLGGTGTGSTTGPAPNQFAQYAGLGLAGAGLFLNRGGRVGAGYAAGGAVGDEIDQSVRSPYQIQTNGGQHQVINVQTGQIHFTGTASGAANAQATLNSRRYAGGGGVGNVQHMADGGVSGTPWSGGVGWIPTMQIHGGSGAPKGSAPSLPQQPGFDATKFASGLASLGKSNVFDSASWGGGSLFEGDAYGGSKSNPIEGLSAADYGYARGGVVGHFAGGGAPDFTDPAWDDPAAAPFAERFAPAAAYPLGEMSRGTGLSLASAGKPSVQAPVGIAGGEAPPAPEGDIYDDGQGPVRLYGGRPDGNPNGLKGVPVSAKADEEEIPEAAAPAAGVLPAGVYRPPYQITPEDYARKPDENAGYGFGLGLISPNAKTGLLTAGLSMLASRSPFLGNAIGEGGLSGLSAYGHAEAQDRKIAEEAQKLSLEAKKAANQEAHTTFTTNEQARHNQATERQAAANSDRTKYTPAGSTIVADGSVHPLVLETTSGKVMDAVTGKPPNAGDKIQPKDGKAPINDDDARNIAEYYVKTGDNSRLNGLGITSAARQAVQKHIRDVMKETGVTPEEMGTRVAEFAGRKAGQRTLATQEAKMGSAAYEAEGAIKLTRGLIEKLPRTGFLPLNQLIQGYQQKTLNPDQAELYARAQAIVNTYSAVMARGANVTTDASRHKAEALLNTAYDAKTYNRILDTLLNEIDMAKHSPEKMRQHYREVYGAKSVAPEGGAQGPAATAAGAPAAGGFQPPPGAIARSYQGKTYYYDPQTKTPYPGQ